MIEDNKEISIENIQKELTPQDVNEATKSLLDSAVNQTYLSNEIASILQSQTHHMEIKDLIAFHNNLSKSRDSTLRTLVGSQALVAAAAQQNLTQIEPSISNKYKDIDSTIASLERGNPEDQVKARNSIQGLDLLGLLMTQLKKDVEESLDPNITFEED